MSFLPSFTQRVPGPTTTGYTEPIEYEIDLKTGQLTGRKVKGKEAVRTWIWLALHVERFRYPLYSWDYGTELDQYISETVTQEFLETDCRTSVEDALLVNPYIKGIEDFKVEVVGSKLIISFRAMTRFGDLEVDTNVRG
ncbi:DUF2634 domain-containing protein [Lacrimispora celerecrescens]|uniref:DUF2634 domain-containing protein n=1 Tax=Lacrimispora celerecrescens TaxID=29354 RepID=UPI001645F620|nr:DUF2634 domain-containing protein [Lacrimispora celerecrescens]